jgi:hypothetical protein
MSLDKIQESIEKIAILATSVGAIHGAFRDKDKGESRSNSILRDAKTGLAVDAGTVAGGAIGMSPAVSRMIRKIKQHGSHDNIPIDELRKMRSMGRVGLVAGGVLGGVGAYNLAKRKNKKK